MNPNCGCIDKVVTINDIVHILSYSSAVAFLSVGRILLEMNSPIYDKKQFFPIFLIFKLFFHETHSLCAVCEPQPQTLATLTLPLLQYH